MKSYREHFSASLSAEPERLHFAAHSHHPWPDVTRAAQLQYWEDSARLLDEKWDHIFGEVFARSQSNIASVLGLTNPAQICLGPNAHAFVARLLSCLDPSIHPVRIVTTDSEFHSFARQIQRYEELENVEVVRVSVEPYASLQPRLEEAVSGEVDLVYVSHVFYNSGLMVPDVTALVKAVGNPGALVAIDGYHAFCAAPVSLGEIEDRAFYIGGGYKYAAAGEGICFMHVPAGSTARPTNTGWFASFADLNKPATDRVEYADNGWRFAGATFDPSGAYRFNAVMQWWKDQGLDTAAVHAHVQELKQRFIDALPLGSLVGADLMLPASGLNEGHFLTFKTPNAIPTQKWLRKKRVIVDSRGDRLRFGFGIYQDEEMLDALISRLG